MSRMMSKHMLAVGVSAAFICACVGDTPQGDTVSPAERLGHDRRALGDPVALTMPAEAIFIGSYVSIGVEIDPSSGLSFEDLRFSVVPPEGGMVSKQQGESADPARPEVRLGVGSRAGEYEIEVTDGQKNSLSKGKFKVTNDWAPTREGPNFWFEPSAEREQYTMGRRYAWGGGPTGVQNWGALPAYGTRRVLAVLVDTATNRIEKHSEAPLVLEDWQASLFDPSKASSRNWFLETSRGKFAVEGDVVGPVSLPRSFESYFVSGDVWWTYPTTFWTVLSILREQQPALSLDDYDVMILVARGGTDPTLFPWPTNYGWQAMLPISLGGAVRRGVVMNAITMPDDWETRPGAGGRTRAQTVTHELGHTLGLDDLYSPVTGRNLGALDTMSSEGAFSQFNLMSKMMLGWVDEDDVVPLQYDGSPKSTNIILDPSAIDRADRSGIEVRVTNGWNYYFELRSQGAWSKYSDTTIESLFPSRAPAVLGTDAVSPGTKHHDNRPLVQLLADDIDGDGWAIQKPGQDYHELDVNYPAAYLIAMGKYVAPDRAEVEISFSQNGQTNPSIRPWPNDKSYKSPDIEIQNDKNGWGTIPELRDMPWEGHPNKIVAHIGNTSQTAATNVRVNFFYKFAGGAAHDNDLVLINKGGPVVIPLIDPQKSEEAVIDGWFPPVHHHYCVIVRILPHVEAGRPELTDMDNEAESNYKHFIGANAAGGGGQRQGLEVTVTNVLEQDVLLALQVDATNPLCRIYLEKSWLVLKPGEVRQVKLETEYAPDDYLANGGDPKIFDEYARHPCRASVSERAFPLTYPPSGPPHLHDGGLDWGGVSIAMSVGIPVKFADLVVTYLGTNEGYRVSGSVVRADNGLGVPGGKVVLSFEKKDDPDEETADAVVPVGPSGTFDRRLLLQDDWKWLFGTFLPPDGYDDAISERIPHP